MIDTMNHMDVKDIRVVPSQVEIEGNMTDRIIIEKRRYSSAPKELFIERVLNSIYVKICVGLFTLLLLGMCLFPSNNTGHRNAARITQSRNNLKFIGIAVERYQDEHDVLPFTNIDYSELKQHGWGYHLLPYLDQEEIYNEIQLEFAWNSPENRAAYQTAIDPYSSPFIDDDLTIGGYAPNSYAANQRLFTKDTSLDLYSIPDGTSNTIMLGEVSTGLKAWGDPTNTRDPAIGIGNMPTQFKSPYNTRRLSSTIFLMMDGSVRSIDNDIDPSVMRALATPDGGEVVDEF